MATGRPKGSKNKTTSEIKEAYAKILGSEVEHVPAVLEKLRKENPYQYMMALDKISNKVVADKKDITTDGQPIVPPQIIIEVESDEQRDSLKGIVDKD